MFSNTIYCCFIFCIVVQTSGVLASSPWYDGPLKTGALWNHPCIAAPYTEGPGIPLSSKEIYKHVHQTNQNLWTRNEWEWKQEMAAHRVLENSELIQEANWKTKYILVNQVAPSLPWHPVKRNKLVCKHF